MRNTDPGIKITRSALATLFGESKSLRQLSGVYKEAAHSVAPALEIAADKLDEMRRDFV